MSLQGDNVCVCMYFKEELSFSVLYLNKPILCFPELAFCNPVILSIKESQIFDVKSSLVVLSYDKNYSTGSVRTV